jgi:hypothetical protein|tara:strand:+ start:358 stop:513 length:156 start_codon:yes stop_codon:yes gene_type:complete
MTWDYEEQKRKDKKLIAETDAILCIANVFVWGSITVLAIAAVLLLIVGVTK